jgi:hypothetical protein
MYMAVLDLAWLYYLGASKMFRARAAVEAQQYLKGLAAGLWEADSQAATALFRSTLRRISSLWWLGARSYEKVPVGVNLFVDNLV